MPSGHMEILRTILSELRSNRDELKIARESKSRIGNEILDVQKSILSELRAINGRQALGSDVDNLPPAKTASHQVCFLSTLIFQHFLFNLGSTEFLA
jgi:hypothetical protein